jgi:hypothetical protein
MLVARIAAGMKERKELKKEAILFAHRLPKKRDLIPVIAIIGASSLRRSRVTALLELCPSAGSAE